MTGTEALARLIQIAQQNSRDPEDIEAIQIMQEFVDAEDEILDEYEA